MWNCWFVADDDGGGGDDGSGVVAGDLKLPSNQQYIIN